MLIRSNGRGIACYALKKNWKLLHEVLHGGVGNYGDLRLIAVGLD